ncbi:MAG: hypothetical protein GY718_10105 [Lentisphaerae bacterium]|nr:hypothetical protein [Lentisphaerota bacterium]
MTKKNETGIVTLYFEDEPKFAFHAKNDEDAISKAREWARYHSFPQSDVGVKPATENEKVNWLHDEYFG